MNTVGVYPVKVAINTCFMLKIDKTKILMTNGSLIKVESIAEWSILQYFLPALRDNWS